MTNPNNCSTCKHHQINDDPTLHCYMFRDIPDEVCLIHTAREDNRKSLDLVLSVMAARGPAKDRALKALVEHCDQYTVIP